VLEYSLTQNQAEAVVKMFVKQISSDFKKVHESIEIVSSNRLIDQPSGATSLFDRGSSKFEPYANSKSNERYAEIELTPRHIPAPNMNLIDDDAPTERSFVMKKKRESKVQAKGALVVCKRQRWMSSEIEKMLEAAKLLGKDYTHIADILGTKTRSQVAKFANDLYHKAVEGHPTPDPDFIITYF
jgi:hypothetical protein